MKEDKSSKKHRETVMVDGIKVSICYERESNPQIVGSMKDLLVKQICSPKTGEKLQKE